MTDTRNMIAQTAERLFAAHAEAARATVEAGDWPEALWNEIAANGLDRVLVPEDAGGFGGGWQDAYVILHAAGRHALPVPLGDTIAATSLLSRAGIAIPDGVLTLADGDTVAISGGRATGMLLRVAWGASADCIVAQVADDAPDTIAAFSPEGAERAADRGIARDRRDSLHADGLAAQTGPGGSVMSAGALARACLMSGAVARVLEMCVAYAGERSQFGRPIGRFQAIQQQLAALAGEAAAADMAAQAACRALDEGRYGFTEIASAKIRAGEAAGRAANIAHQVHGAIGFTDEHGLHHVTRRLWTWRAEFGVERIWADGLGRLVVAEGAEGLWPRVTSTE